MTAQAPLWCISRAQRPECASITAMKAAAIAIFLFGLAGSAGAAEKRLPAGKAENPAVSISATVLDAEHIRNAVSSDFDNHYVVVEVTITPKGAEPLAVSLNDFILRSQASGEHTGPLVASQIAGSGELIVKRTYADRTGAGEPKLIAGTKVEMKNGSAGDAERDKQMLEQLKAKILAEKNTAEPLTGLLFFPLEKEKPKNLALSYSGPKGKLRIEFK